MDCELEKDSLGYWQWSVTVDDDTRSGQAWTMWTAKLHIKYAIKSIKKTQKFKEHIKQR